MATHADSKEAQPADRHGRSEKRQPASRDTAAAAIVDSRASSQTMQRMQDIATGSPQAMQLRQQAEQQANALASSPAGSVGRENKTNNSGLPAQLKSGIESLSGMSMDHVKVHYNSAMPAQLQAHAYAQGSEIHVAPGQERHLPHEAWHVVQQAQGRVKPTVQMKAGVAVNDDAGLEAEADAMGSRAQSLGDMQANAVQLAMEPAIPSSSVPHDVAQLLTVADDHVRGDLRHKDRAKLFTEETFDDINGRLASGNLDTSSNVQLDLAVNQSRAAAQMDYKVMSSEKVTSEKQMANFLAKNPDDEHMYVLEGEDLHVAIRAESKKLPHPTLVGGDPDVDCAGTIRDEDGTVVVTASSGHFRPPSEGPGKKHVAKMMGKTGTKTYGKKVAGKRR